MQELLYILDTPFMRPLIALTAGAVIGSFLNVVIHRLPRMMYKDWREQCDELRDDAEAKALGDDMGENNIEGNLTLAAPRSRCPRCRSPVRPAHNIPIISYLWLRGKCADCGGDIGRGYFIVELGCALLAVYLTHRFGFSMTALFYILFTFLLVPLVFIDLRHKLLPDSIVWLVLWSGVIHSLLGFGVALEDSVYGVLAGYLSLWSVYVVFKLITGKEGMGHGDFKLFAALGAWVGWSMLLPVILIASVCGTIAGLVLAYGNKNNPDASRAFAFGPYLAISGWITLLWGEHLTAWYLGLF